MGLIGPGDVGKRICLVLKDNSRKIEGKILSVTERLIVVQTDSHNKHIIPFTLLYKIYNYRIH